MYFLLYNLPVIDIIVQIYPASRLKHACYFMVFLSGGYMRSIIVLFILFPTLAFGAVQLNFKDGSIMCGPYVDNGTAYCKKMSGGEVCWQKSDIKSTLKVDECPDINDDQSTGNVNTTPKQLLKEKKKR